ncbi:MAG: hypothetical protein ACI96N_003504 [Arenicella sp.]
MISIFLETGLSTFIFAFIFFIVVVVAMSVGYIFQQKTIAGSCGGLGALGIAKACDCPEPCDRKKMRLEKVQAREAKLNQWKKDQIL